MQTPDDKSVRGPREPERRDRQLEQAARRQSGARTTVQLEHRAAPAPRDTSTRDPR